MKNQNALGHSHPAFSFSAPSFGSGSERLGTRLLYSKYYPSVWIKRSGRRLENPSVPRAKPLLSETEL